MVSSQDVFTILILSISAVIGIPGNVLVLWIIGVKVKRTATNIWFWNLALADGICCLTFLLFVVQFFHDRWLYGLVLCKMLAPTVICTMFASIFTLVAISVDRCILVVHPVWAKHHRTLPKAWIICLVIWMLSFLMCLPAVLYRTTYTEKNLTQCGYRHMDPQYSNGSDSVYVTFPDKAVTYTRMVFGFLIPFLIISVSYANLTSKLKQTRLVKVSRKTSRVVFGVVIAFFVSWAPYHIMGIVLLYSGEEDTLVNTLDYLSQALANFNSCINPILYVLLGKDMKKTVRQSIQQLMENVFTEEMTKRTPHSNSNKSTTDESLQLDGPKLEINLNDD